MHRTDSSAINGLIIDRVTDDAGVTELRLCPAALAGKRVARRTAITGRPESRVYPPLAVSFDSLVQVKLAEDDGGGPFLAGVTMRDSVTEKSLRATADPLDAASDRLTTTLQNQSGALRLRAHLQGTEIEGTLLAWTEITNTGPEPVTLENLSSFVLGGITPFAADSAPRRLRAHRFRSWWSNEGRHENLPLEELHLDRNWQGFPYCVERFGQVGTMPVRKFFPFVAIEDTEAGVCWGAQLAWSGSWQLDIARRGDAVSIAGGLADYEFGHWRKTLAPGETFTTPVAHLACVAGPIDELTHRLVRLQETLLTNLPKSENELPVVFNEWCTNWGSPSHDNILALARRLQGSGVKYIVIDDGWAVRPPEATAQSNGDWIVDRKKFPDMKATCDAIRALGFIPGVWFEFEVCNPGSLAWAQDTHHLRRDGRPLRVGTRRFWDLNDPWVVDYLDQRLIGFLKENGFGYLKVDYNDNIGVGCDHPDSQGEGLRRHVEGIHRVFRRLREKVDALVIENCSSGGHRLEPAMMNLTSMSSFSDAHESWNIPVVARQVQHLIPPRQSQIWAVLYPDDSAERFVYSLTSTFYGRMCLSGPVHDLSDAQMAVVKHATSLYAKCAPVIREGRTTFLGETPLNWNNPTGWQGIRRVNVTGDRALVVVHAFAEAPTSSIKIKLPGADWRILDQLHDGTAAAPGIEGTDLVIPQAAPLRGWVLLLGK